ncbi:MAG TPA: hypothetical protein VJT73_13085 [Polyangiaceae bacterium]|nr:hypothetical protein [Polyangiaceae bacterium]
MNDDDDLYGRHQTLAALVSVLLHDLRNPLHSATLLVEAMGSRTMDFETMRGKLRTQFTKLEALISEATGSARDLTIRPRIEEVSVATLLRKVEAARPLPRALGQAIVAVDPALVLRAISELVESLAELSAQSNPGAEAAAEITVAAEQPDPDSVRIHVSVPGMRLDEALQKAPFTIAAGGMRLAIARALAQNAGASLRFDRPDDGTTRFALVLRSAAISAEAAAPSARA